MKKEDAIELIHEALFRLECPTPNANGGTEQVGGAYWRLAKVLEKYLCPRLEQQEGAKHAGMIKKAHGVICRSNA